MLSPTSEAKPEPDADFFRRLLAQCAPVRASGDGTSEYTVAVPSLLEGTHSARPLLGLEVLLALLSASAHAYRDLAVLTEFPRRHRRKSAIARMTRQRLPVTPRTTVMVAAPCATVSGLPRTAAGCAVSSDLDELAIVVAEVNVAVVVEVRVAAAVEVRVTAAVEVRVAAVVEVGVATVVDVGVAAVAVVGVTVVVEVTVAAEVEVGVAVVVEATVAAVVVDPGFVVKHEGRMRVSVSCFAPHVPPHSALQLAERERICVPVPQPAGDHASQPP